MSNVVEIIRHGTMMGPWLEGGRVSVVNIKFNIV